MRKLFLHVIFNNPIVFGMKIRMIPQIFAFCLLLVLEINGQYHYTLSSLSANVGAQETPAIHGVSTPDIEQLLGANVTTSSNLAHVTYIPNTGDNASSRPMLIIPDPELGKSPNGFNSPHCTWWVDWCVNANKGNKPPVDFKNGGVASEWWNGVENCKKSPTPSVGSVMVIDGCAGLLAGHVAYVIAVQDHKHFTITHANYPWPSRTAPHICNCTIDAAGKVIIDGEQLSLPLLGFLRPPGW